jgi:hypothetical protein
VPVNQLLPSFRPCPWQRKDFLPTFLCKKSVFSLLFALTLGNPDITTFVAKTPGNARKTVKTDGLSCKNGQKRDEDRQGRRRREQKKHGESAEL